MMAGSWSLVRLHRLERRDPHGDDGRVEAGEDAHQDHDGEGDGQAGRAELWNETRARVEEVELLVGGRDAARHPDEPDHGRPQERARYPEGEAYRARLQDQH